jgi:hypothetical protein
MNPLTPYLLWIKLGAAAALIVGLFAFGHHQGAKSVQAEWDLDNGVRAEATNKAMIKRVDENVALAQKQSDDNAALTKAHDAELAQVRATIVNQPRLRIGAGICPRLAGAPDPQSAGRSDAADTRVGLLRPDIQRDIDALKLQMEEVAATGRAAQAFITDNGMAP